MLFCVLSTAPLDTKPKTALSQDETGALSLGWSGEKSELKCEMERVFADFLVICDNIVKW